MTMLSAQFKNLLDRHLNEVSDGVYKTLISQEAMIPTIFDVSKMDSAWWEGQEMTDYPDIPAFSGELEYIDMGMGYSTRIEPGEYAAGTRFERKLIDDKKWPVLNNAAAGMTEAMFRTREKEAVNLFTGGFSSAFTFMSSEEAVALCSSSHTSKSGAVTTYGFANAGSSALDELSLEATRILANKFKSDVGERIFTNFDTLIVPDNLAKTAYEITQTPAGLYSAESTINVQAGKPFSWKVIVYKLMDDADSNNWFLVDSRAMKKFVKWFNRIEIETSNEFREFDTFALKRSIYARWGWGFTNWRWCYGHAVS